MTKKQPKELRIETLLTAAVEEFLVKGFEGASIDAIAKRAGISKGGFYHHFPNKEVLLMEVNKKLSEPIMEMIVAAYSNPSPIEGLKSYSKAYVKYWVTRPKELSFFFLSMAKAFDTPILMMYYKEYIVQSTLFFTGLFRKAVELGEVDVKDPDAYGISLMGALDGLLSYAIMHPNEEVDQLIDRMGKIWFEKG